MVWTLYWPVATLAQNNHLGKTGNTQIETQTQRGKGRTDDKAK